MRARRDGSPCAERRAVYLGYLHEGMFDVLGKLDYAVGSLGLGAQA